MIYPEHRVTWSLSPVSLEFLLLQRETDEVWARSGGRQPSAGGRVASRGAEFSCMSISVRLHYMRLSSHFNENTVCQHRDRPPCGLARILIVDEHVCVPVSLCVCLCCAGSREGINLAL